MVPRYGNAMMNLRLLLILLFLLSGCMRAERPAAVVRPAVRPPVILISIDGFRPDYLERGVTPTLNALAAAGVRARAMRPSFPTLTFPNHYSLVTGLRPDRHGIVNNTIEDPAIPGVRFSLGNRAAVIDRRWWDAAEPIWVTAEKAGVRTATMFWPGSEADVRGVRPAHWAVFDGAMPGEARVDTLLGWLDLPDRPGFMTLYFDEVDHDGHGFGPDSAAVTAAAGRVDGQIGRLLTGLKARGIAANIIIVSDHGMAATAPERVIRLDMLLPTGSFRVVTAGAVAGLEAMPGQGGVLAAALARVTASGRDHMRCWPRLRIPARFGYGRNARVPAFVCIADVGWLILGAAPREPVQAGGMHGYDQRDPAMAATFIAAGPAFRAGTVLPPFDNVDVYPLAMRLLGVRALASDGRIAPLAKALRHRHSLDR